MALAALCGSDTWGDTWAKVLQHRFAGNGEMRGHVVGNLLIVGLWELLGDHVDALDWVGRLLGAKGRVLPMALVPMDITAEVRGLADDPEQLTTVRGQVEVATTEGVITSIDLEPPDPPVSPVALERIAEADWAFIGPGSWFSSVIPHVRVPALREALAATSARVVVVLNLEEQAGETGGFGPADHLAVLFEHAPQPAGPHRAGRRRQRARRAARRAAPGGRRGRGTARRWPTSRTTTAHRATTP